MTTFASSSELGAFALNVGTGETTVRSNGARRSGAFRGFTTVSFVVVAWQELPPLSVALSVRVLPAPLGITTIAVVIGAARLSVPTLQVTVWPLPNVQVPCDDVANTYSTPAGNVFVRLILVASC